MLFKFENEELVNFRSLITPHIDVICYATNCLPLIPSCTRIPHTYDNDTPCLSCRQSGNSDELNLSGNRTPIDE